jgi:hypothetical protein
LFVKVRPSPSFTDWHEVRINDAANKNIAGAAKRRKHGWFGKPPFVPAGSKSATTIRPANAKRRRNQRNIPGPPTLVASRLVTLCLVSGRHEHGSENTAVGENPEAILVGKFANERFAMFVIERRPNAFQLFRTHKTLSLGFERRFDSLNEGVHGFCAILPNHEFPSIGIILILARLL